MTAVAPSRPWRCAVSGQTSFPSASEHLGAAHERTAGVGGVTGTECQQGFERVRMAGTSSQEYSTRWTTAVVFCNGGNGRDDDGKTKDGALSGDGSNTWKSRGGRDQERSELRQITACAADRSCAPLRLARLSGLLLTPIPAPYHPSRRHRSAILPPLSNPTTPSHPLDPHTPELRVLYPCE